jgi:hypothetical protein
MIDMHWMRIVCYRNSLVMLWTRKSYTKQWLGTGEICLLKNKGDSEDEIPDCGGMKSHRHEICGQFVGPESCPSGEVSDAFIVPSVLARASGCELTAERSIPAAG